MNAGPLPDTGAIDTFVVQIDEPLVVEIDTEATAVYIRIRSGKSARTEPYGSENGLVMIDYNAQGEVLGFEIIGQQDFSIRELAKVVPIRASEAILNQTRYVAADLQEIFIGS